jgi:hypothetical protein
VKTLRRFLTILAALPVLASCTAPPADPQSLARRVAATREPTVLFIGNSYSFGVPRAFAKLAASHGKRVRVDQVTHSGWTLARHADSRETLGKIRSGRWDIVVLQEQSRIPSLPALRPFLMFPNVRRLAAEARTRGAQPVLYQTWAGREGDPKRPGDDFHAMTRRLRQGYRLAAQDAGGLPLVPAGDFWQHEVAAGRGETLFQADGSHPTATGDALTARAFYEALFGTPPGS